MPRARSVHACRCSTEIKCDIDNCNRECGVQEFPPRLFGKRKVLRMGMVRLVVKIQERCIDTRVFNHCIRL